MGGTEEPAARSSHPPAPGRRSGPGEAVEYIAEAALIGLRLSPDLRETLLQSPEAPLRGTSLQEVIYLARAGARPLRQLAARRLAGCAEPASIATLTQHLYDRDGPVSETALWALQHLAPPNLGAILACAFRDIPLDRTHADVPPIQRALLFVLAAQPDEEACAALREALGGTELLASHPANS